MNGLLEEEEELDEVLLGLLGEVGDDGVARDRLEDLKDGQERNAHLAVGEQSAGLEEAKELRDEGQEHHADVGPIVALQQTQIVVEEPGDVSQTLQAGEPDVGVLGAKGGLGLGEQEADEEVLLRPLSLKGLEGTDAPSFGEVEADLRRLDRR